MVDDFLLLCVFLRCSHWFVLEVVMVVVACMSSYVVCVCACAYVCVRVCVCVHTCMRVHARMHVCLHVM